MLTRSARVSAGATIAAALFIALGCGNVGCSNEVTQGTGGAKTTSTSTGVVASATVSTSVGTSATSSGASTTTGGGTACDMACSKAAGCGFDFCGQFQALDCNSAPQACAADCINNASCAAIVSLQNIQMGGADPSITGCLIACAQGTSTTGTGAGGGMATGCNQCLGQHQGCVPQGCFGNAACQAWGQCVLACGNQGPSCYSACDAAHPTAASFYDQFYSCACTNCDTQCGAQIAPCTHGGTTASTGTGM